MGTYLHFDPDNARSYVGFVMPSDQLAALDEARISSRQSRSEFLRQALAAYLRQRQSVK